MLTATIFQNGDHRENHYLIAAIHGD